MTVFATLTSHGGTTLILHEDGTWSDDQDDERYLEQVAAMADTIRDEIDASSGDPRTYLAMEMARIFGMELALERQVPETPDGVTA